MKKTAFTLAEVLITLAIIGVVAAMTIPTLVTHNQEKGWNTSATVFERKLGEALSVMNTQQNLTGLGTTENFVAELSRHFKIVNTCSNSNLSKCFESSFTWNDNEKHLRNITTAQDFGHKDWNTNIIGIQTASGVNALVAYNPRCTADPYSNQSIGIGGGVTKNNGSVKISTDCLAVLYDVQGNSKPNTKGKDVRAINVDLPVCLSGTCYKPAFIANSSPVDCTDINTTRNPDFQYCAGNSIHTSGAAYSNDYWAGAVKTCGGRDKMASRSQLTQIANYIYGTNVSAGDDTQINASFTAESGSRAAEFGLPSSAGFFVWANTHTPGQNGRVSYGRTFNENASYGGTLDNMGMGSKERGSQDGWVICIGE